MSNLGPGQALGGGRCGTGRSDAHDALRFGAANESVIRAWPMFRTHSTESRRPLARWSPWTGRCVSAATDPEVHGVQRGIGMTLKVALPNSCADLSEVRVKYVGPVAGAIHPPVECALR